MHQNPFLESLFAQSNPSQTDLSRFIPEFEEVFFDKNELLFEAGKPTKHYYFLEEGTIRSYAISADGNDVSTEFFTKGDIVIDWPSFFMRQPTKENYQALSAGKAWRLGFEKFQELFSEVESFREAGRARLVSSYFALKRKSVSMITDEAKQRYVQLLKERPAVVQNVPLKHIATYLGITDTSLSRIRKELAQPE